MWYTCCSIWTTSFKMFSMQKMKTTYTQILCIVVGWKTTTQSTITCNVIIIKGTRVRWVLHIAQLRWTFESSLKKQYRIYRADLTYCLVLIVSKSKYLKGHNFVKMQYRVMKLELHVLLVICYTIVCLNCQAHTWASFRSIQVHVKI